MCCWNRGKNHGHNSSLHPKTPELQAHKRLVSLLPVRFTPDFTSSRVIRELKLVTCGGSEFVFVLNASLPYHMLAACAESLPRPSWELELYIIVCLIMRSVSPRFFFMVWYFVYATHSGAPLPPLHSCMFLLVLTTAYLEAQSIWEPFKKRVSVESNSSLETGRPFNLREIVQNHSDSKYVVFIIYLFIFPHIIQCRNQQYWEGGGFWTPLILFILNPNYCYVKYLVNKCFLCVCWKRFGCIRGTETNGNYFICC